jgi:adenosylmethionine-8-amino-7-oxononanoate aminotransferase
MGQYRESGHPLVIERASGSRLFDVDGRSIIDGNASWWTALLGHNHPRLVLALREQSERLCHTSLAGVTHEPAIRFAEALQAVAPAGLNHVFFSDNGSTAVEAALKLAVQFFAQGPSPGRQKTKFISLQDAFHGETMGATALGGVEAFRAPFADLVMPCIHLPSPADGESRSLEMLEKTLKSEGQRLAAFVVEPLIQGAGGMRMYGPSYLQEARRLTEKYDVLFIVDEVFTGYGRTAKFWACDHAQVSADIVCSARGLSGGILPFAATLVSDRVYDGFLGDSGRAFYYGHTYCGNPLGAAVALAVLSVYQDEQILVGAAARAQLIESSFERMGRLVGVEDSRSLGVCGALNLRGGRGYLERGGWEVYERALERGAYLRPLGNVVYVTPPLNIPEEDLKELLSILEESVAEVVAAAAKK